MPNKGFTFFCICLGLDFLASGIPVVREFSVFFLPLIVMVSGWRYAAYFLLITSIPSIPDYINSFGAIQGILPLAFSPNSAQSNETIKSLVNTIPPHPAFLNSPFFGFMIASIGIVVLIVMAISMVNGIRRYIRTLRIIHKLTRSWHR